VLSTKGMTLKHVASRSILVSCALAVFFCLPVSADVVLPAIFSDHMVLQADAVVPVWGCAEPNELVTVVFGSHTKSATAKVSGKWMVKLDSLKAGEAATLIVKGKNTLVFNDVIVGEVWLCSGQSNMAWTVDHSKDAEKEVAEATHPLIRHFKVALAAAGATADSARGVWEVCSPETAGRFSAVAYYFGRELGQELKVPVGLLNISYGGSPVESWMSEATLRGNPAFASAFEREKQSKARYPAQQKLYEQRLAAWQAEQAAARQAKREFTKRPPRKPTGDGVDRFTPAALYNAMLHPFIPYAVRGVIWFQGEANYLRSEEYRSLFPAMIAEWRGEFGQGDLPFYYVQLANQARLSDATGVQFAFQREAQAAALKLPNTGVAVSVDIGEANNPHFKNKQEVGRRLSLIALANVYGRKKEWSGPVVEKIERKGPAMQVAFSHADGLKLTGASPGGFELAGPDKVFRPAIARIDGGSVVVTSDQVTEPVALRYAWHNNPAVTLYNGAGLPASPFRSDAWPVPVPSAVRAAGGEGDE